MYRKNDLEAEPEDENGNPKIMKDPNAHMLEEIDALIMISKFHDNYFQFKTKNNFRMKEIDTTKFWKEQFRDNKQLYYLFEYKTEQQKREKASENYFYSFKKNFRELDLEWMRRI